MIIVDNGCTDGAITRLRQRDGVTMVGDGTNVGFAQGCNIGVAAARAPVVAMINPDALVAADALALLIAALDEPGVEMATASLRLADRPDLLNAAGLAVHFLGFSWAAHFEEPATGVASGDVAGASGAAMAMRRDRWLALDGMCPEFFAYYEDCDLSLRVRQQGGRVRYVAEAVVTHRYEFGRHPTKFFLVERNRLVMVLSLWSTRSLMLLAPVLAVMEVAVFALAVRQGWWRHKVRAWWWILRRAGWITRRRRHWRAACTVSDRELSDLHANQLDPGNFALPDGVAPLQRLLRGYWGLARRFL